MLGLGSAGDAKHAGRASWVILGMRVTNLTNRVEARVTRLAWIATRVRDHALLGSPHGSGIGLRLDDVWVGLRLLEYVLAKFQVNFSKFYGTFYGLLVLYAGHFYALIGLGLLT